MVIVPLAFTAWYPVMHYQSLQEVLLLFQHIAMYHCHMTAVQKGNQSTVFLRDFANNGLVNQNVMPVMFFFRHCIPLYIEYFFLL